MNKVEKEILGKSKKCDILEIFLKLGIIKENIIIPRKTHKNILKKFFKRVLTTVFAYGTIRLFLVNDIHSYMHLYRA